MGGRRFFIYLGVCVLIGAFLFAPLVEVGAVALAQVLTPTNTFVPPSPTATSSDFSCPQGTPAGWGTYTPSPLWLVQCSNCGSFGTPTGTATGTSLPTLNPTLFPTAYALTGTASAFTPTPIATSIPVGSGVEVTTGAVVEIHQIGTGMTLLSNDVVCSGGSFVHCTGFYTFSFVFGSTGRGLGAFVNVSSLDGVPFTGYKIYSKVSVLRHDTGADAWTTHGIFGADYDNNLIWHTTNGSTYSRLRDMSVQYVDVRSGLPGVVSRDVQLTFQYPRADKTSMVVWRSTVDTYISLLTQNLLTPSPTPAVATATVTPFFDTGYCSSVSPVDSVFGFDLFSPDGALNCDMGWQEFGINTDLDEEYEYSVPAVQICIQPSKFGVIRLFGKDYEVGVFGLAAAAAFLWRYFRTV